MNEAGSCRNGMAYGGRASIAASSRDGVAAHRGSTSGRSSDAAVQRRAAARPTRLRVLGEGKATLWGVGREVAGPLPPQADGIAGVPTLGEIWQEVLAPAPCRVA